jgi:hypothetical protein
MPAHDKIIDGDLSLRLEKCGEPPTDRGATCRWDAGVTTEVHALPVADIQQDYGPWSVGAPTARRPSYPTGGGREILPIDRVS